MGEGADYSYHQTGDLVDLVKYSLEMAKECWACIPICS